MLRPPASPLTWRAVYAAGSTMEHAVPHASRTTIVERLLSPIAEILKAPSVSTMTWLKVFDNSLDYSVGNTAKQALWLPTSRVAKYKAKQAVDSFFMRAGDVLQAGIVFVGERLAFTVPPFAAVNVVLALGWIAVVSALNPAYRAQAAAVTREPDAAGGLALPTPTADRQSALPHSPVPLRTR